jgi:PAS domain S-box-containing protein
MDPFANAPSLLNHVDAPVVVADPDGRVVFLNPAFETCFVTTRERSHGRALAELFEGGDREAVLAAVAATCARGQSVRFRIRHHHRGFQVLASPIAIEGERVGSVLLLTEDLLEGEAVHRVRRELGTAVERMAECLDRLVRPDAQLAEGERSDWAAGAHSALAECRRAATDLARLTEGRQRHDERSAVIDPGRVLRDALAGVAYEVADADVRVDLLLAPELPLIRGDGKRLQEALEALLRRRVAGAPPWLSLGGHSEVARGATEVVLTLTDPAGDDDAADGPPPVVLQSVAALGGTLQVARRGDGSRVAELRFPAL